MASVIDFVARQTHRAATASAQAETLSEPAVSVLRGEEAVAALLAQVRETFGMDSAGLPERVDPDAPARPDEQDDPAA